MHIKIKRGLDVPISGEPTGEIRDLPKPKQVALDLSPFPEIKFKVLVEPDAQVKLGEPLALDKRREERKFVSPAGGRVCEIRRGLKRRLLNIVIEIDENEDTCSCSHLNLGSTSREELVNALCEGGLFAHIRQRPFGLLADPRTTPGRIFVRAVESAPFTPPAEMQVEGFEKSFALGLAALTKLTDGDVHLVHRPGAFDSYEGVKSHTIEGPHPSGTSSVHIHEIAPIRGLHDVVWTLDMTGVVAIGELLIGRYHTARTISIAGTCITPDQRGFYRARAGYPIANLIEGRAESDEYRLISGDPLHGDKVEGEDFLGFQHLVFSALDDRLKRQLFTFLRLGFNKFSAHKIYGSGHRKRPGPFSFSTSLRGEERAFIDTSAYNKVMPMRIPTVQLVKAIIAEDWDLAEELGIYEVDAEDFALSTFVCPSKVEMVEIVRNGLQNLAAEALV